MTSLRREVASHQPNPSTSHRDKEVHFESSDPNLLWTTLLLSCELAATALGVWCWLHSDALSDWVRRNQLTATSLADLPTQLVTCAIAAGIALSLLAATLGESG